jgi:hypothetical protein
MLRVLVAFILIVGLVAGWYAFRDKYYYCFDADTIEQARGDIRDKITERLSDLKGMAKAGEFRAEVVEVALIRESCKRLTGYVKLRVRAKKDTAEFSRNCSATMGEGSSEFIWSCEQRL